MFIQFKGNISPSCSYQQLRILECEAWIGSDIYTSHFSFRAWYNWWTVSQSFPHLKQWKHSYC